MTQHLVSILGLGLSFATCFGVTGCSRQETEAPAAEPPTVTVSYPLKRQVSDYEDYTGRTAAVDSVSVRARVSGYLDKIYFKDGAEVEKGAVLYLIDPRPYQAALDQAEAQVRLQQANLKYQQALYDRDVRLLGPGAVSKEEAQKDLAAAEQARAQVNATKAAVEQARLNLEFTRVTAPISGRLGRTLITIGNLIVADQTLLTSIVSLDPTYAYFDADEPTVLRVQRLIREAKFHSAREPGVRIPVHLGLASETDYPHEGHIDFINNQVDPATGTLQIRGVFANPKPPVGPRVLSPGLFVRIRVSIGPPYEALLVTQAAVGTDQNVKYIYVLDDQNQVVRRDVTLGIQQGDLQVIRKGLTAKDRVIINGLQHVRPDLVVNPKVVPMPSETRQEDKETAKKGPGDKETRRQGEKDASPK